MLVCTSVGLSNQWPSICGTDSVTVKYLTMVKQRCSCISLKLTVCIEIVIDNECLCRDDSSNAIYTYRRAAGVSAWNKIHNMLFLLFGQSKIISRSHSEITQRLVCIQTELFCSFICGCRDSFYLCGTLSLSLSLLLTFNDSGNNIKTTIEQCNTNYLIGFHEMVNLPQKKTL